MNSTETGQDVLVNVFGRHRAKRRLLPKRGGGKPRVLVLVTLAEIGGAQSYVADLVPALAADYEVTVAAHGDGPLGTRVRATGATYVPLRFVRRDVSILDLAGLFEVWLLCFRLRPDLIHANSSKAGVIGRLAGALAGVRVRVFTAHGWAFAAASGKEARLYTLVERALRPITSAVICVSEREQRRGIEARASSHSRSFVIPNAVDARRFNPTAGARGRMEDGLVEAISVGRLAPPKDFATLIAAVAGFPDRRLGLRILGDGPDRRRLEELTEALGINDRVRFEGTVEDVAPYLEDADFFVLSSTSEGMPMSILEAMAAGLPVVATDVGGVRELVDSATGIVVPSQDTVALTEALGTLVADAGFRHRLGAAGRERAVSGFGLSAWGAHHRLLYAQLLARTPLTRVGD